MCQVMLGPDLEAIRARYASGNATQADVGRLLEDIDAAAHSLALARPDVGPSLAERREWVLRYWGVPVNLAEVQFR